MDGSSEVVSAEMTGDRGRRSATVAWEGLGQHSGLQVSRRVKWRLTKSPYGGAAELVAFTRGDQACSSVGWAFAGLGVGLGIELSCKK